MWMSVQHAAHEQSKERHKKQHVLLELIKRSSVFPDCVSVVAVNSITAWFPKADYFRTKFLHKYSKGSFASLIACNHNFAWDKYTVLQQETATHLFRFRETFTAPDESHLSLNTRKSKDPFTLSPSTWPRNQIWGKKKENVACKVFLRQICLIYDDMQNSFVKHMLRSSVVICSSGVLVNVWTVLIGLK